MNEWMNFIPDDGGSTTQKTALNIITSTLQCPLFTIGTDNFSIISTSGIYLG
jgi:hypothetical protein